jgi:hypothetical protein
VDVRPQNIEELVEILSRIDPSAPDARDASGRPVFHLRCKIPVVLDVPSGGFRFRKREEGGEAQREAGGAQTESEGRGILDRIEGPASSTSVDWYGTRMTLPALEDMASQFRKGVDYLPRHHTWMRSVEWDETMGVTVDARIERAQVAEPAEGDGEGDGWILYATTDLFDDCPQCETMLSRIQMGRPPGQSIGGWFTQVSVTYDEDGYVIYPIDVLGVQLDHLAAVRSPANPDANKVWLAVQRQLEELGQVFRSAPVPEPPAPTAEPPVPATTVVLDIEPDEAPASRSIENVLANCDPEDVVRYLTSSGQGSAAPIPEPRSSGRLEFPNMTPEQLAALISRSVADSLAVALGPISARLDALEAAQNRTAPAPEPNRDATPPAPTETSAERVMRERAEAAEARARESAARLAALEAEPQRQAARNTPNPAAPTPSGAPQIPAFARVGSAGDLRSIAPMTARIVARAGDEIGEAEIPHVVWQRDGLDALSQYAKALGEAPTVNALVAREKALTVDPSRISDTGHDFAVFRGGLYPEPTQLRCKSDAELKAILADLVYAATRDRIVQ